MKENLSSEIKASQEKYEKGVGNIVKKYGGSFWEKLFGLGIISKEEVIRMDAQMENGALEKTKMNPNDIDAKTYLEKLRKSNVILDTFFNDSQLLETLPNFSSSIGYNLDGTIDNKKVEIVFVEDDKKHLRDGFLDGKELSSEEVEKIFKEYYPIAKERYLKIQEIGKQNKEKLNKELWEEEENTIK